MVRRDSRKSNGDTNGWDVLIEMWRIVPALFAGRSSRTMLCGLAIIASGMVGSAAFIGAYLHQDKGTASADGCAVHTTIVIQQAPPQYSCSAPSQPSVATSADEDVGVQNFKAVLAMVKLD